MSDRKGITNLQIEQTIKKSQNKHLKKFVSIFLSNLIVKFISLNKLMKNRQKRYGFLILNADRSDKPDRHWWSILDIHPKNSIFLFDSFGVLGLKNFNITDDSKIINKIILLGLEKI